MQRGLGGVTVAPSCSDTIVHGILSHLDDIPMHTLALVPDEPDVGNRRRNALNILASTSSRNLAVHQS